MNYQLISITHSELKTVQIKSICQLKDMEWKFGIKSQLNGLKRTLKKMISIIYFILNLN